LASIYNGQIINNKGYGLVLGSNTTSDFKQVKISGNQLGGIHIAAGSQDSRKLVKLTDLVDWITLNQEKENPP